MTLSAPSLRHARDVLKATLTTIDDAHDKRLHALPDGHSWRDVDILETERSRRVVEAYDTFKQAERLFTAYVAKHADDEDEA